MSLNQHCVAGKKKFKANIEIPPGRTRTKGAGVKTALTNDQEKEVVEWFNVCRERGVAVM